MNEIKQLKSLFESLTQLEESLAKYSYQDDFQETHPKLPMRWSIYKDGSTDGDYEKWILDFTTDAPDGTWPVMYDFDGNDTIAEGVRVEGGAFDIVPTINAVSEAVKDSGYWGQFIEAMEWDGQFEVFRVTVGS